MASKKQKKKQNNPNVILRKANYQRVQCCWNCEKRYIAYDDNAGFAGHKCESTKQIVKFDHACDNWEDIIEIV